MVSHSTVRNQNTDDAINFRKQMLGWYDAHRRVLPWRALPEEKSDPYYVWLSEIMLQQTTVQTVIPYFIKFIKKWPTVKDLARAKNDDVMSSWAGLGYYARARNLHKCAKIITSEYNSVFPSDEHILKTLPGIGEYTAAAIASIAFDKTANVVDGNVERIMARYHTVSEPLPQGKKILKKYASYYSNDFSDRCGDYAQALMDLGATICSPKSPKCSLCPLNDSCKAYLSGDQESYPVRSKKKEKPKRFGYVYWVMNEKGYVLVHKRQEKGLLGGMYGFPTSEWDESRTNITHLNILNDEILEKQQSVVEHIFTHFHLTLFIYTALTKRDNFPEDYSWVKLSDVEMLGLPTTFDKVCKTML